MSKMTFAIIVGNRGFFPDHLAQTGRADMIDVLTKAGHDVVALEESDTKFGAVETLADAKKCAELFKSRSGDIDGVIITLPNFGDEKSATEVMKRAELDVPILVQAEPDLAATMTNKDRRDSFCGKISVCNNLRQSAFPYTLTTNHTVAVKSDEFKSDLDDFAAVCRIVKGLRNVRFGAVGARTGAFNTVRFSEKILEDSGISVETIDLSEVFGRAEKLQENDAALQAKLKALQDYTVTSGVPAASLMRMARFGVVVEQWVEEMELNGTAVQCWTAMEEYFGIAPCTVMSAMSESLLPSACEVDITGLLGMYILQLASQSPSALLDWNNNYGDDEDKCVLFHCSNLPKSFFETSKMDYQAIVGGTVGNENAYGTIVGRITPGAATFLRTNTDDTEGVITAYVGEGEFTDDTLETFGGYGVMKIPGLQDLMHHICNFGFEHHVAVNRCLKASAINEALDNYMGWDIYYHE